MIMTVTSMLDNVLRIATRQSPLALWQAHYVKDKLMASHPGLVVELVPMVTRGDVILDTPLAKVGGKGLFVKELEVALLENRADIAVHSMKDVPVEFPQGLGLVTICEREDPRDAFVSNNYDSLDALPAGSIVGTSSLRRQCQLAERRPDLIIRSLRGNVGTRLSKLDNGEYDSIILALPFILCKFLITKAQSACQDPLPDLILRFAQASTFHHNTDITLARMLGWTTDDNDGNKHVRQCFKNCHTPKHNCNLAGTLCQRQDDVEPSGPGG